MKMRPRYTKEEDERIKNCPRGDLAALAKDLGRPYGGVNGRKQKLRSGETTNPIHRLKSEPKLAASIKMTEVKPRFARPAWFNEDLTTLAQRQK